MEEQLTKESLLCQACNAKEFGLGQYDCPEHGNAYIDYKCQYCCNVAQFRCGAQFFCQPCHNDAMNGGAFVNTDCCGGPSCPLGVDYHPKASSDSKEAMFSLGCSLCRSEKLDSIVSHNNGNGGFNVEQRRDMKERFDHILGNNIRH